jgi:hypothetical protein
MMAERLCREAGRRGRPTPLLHAPRTLLLDLRPGPYYRWFMSDFARTLTWCKSLFLPVCNQLDEVRQAHEPVPLAFAVCVM